MATDLRIRPATPEDIPAITEIYRPAVLTGTASFELEPPSVDEMRRRFETITSGGYPYLVAEHEGAVIGYSYASAYRTRPGYRFSVEDSVYVVEGQQGKGVGRALLSRLIEECTARGYRQMVAIIGDSAQWASIGLHRKLGFTFVGTLHSIGYKHGRWLDTVIMQRTLGEGDCTPPA
ncbi:MAG: GNAT family N-acetyltransferase [Proteobacteria bacterium]|jgi:Sortase and related acyltransferases|nr:MAG: GNAT family N-acetyltransferase [Pseudomonadota bacterium]